MRPFKQLVDVENDNEASLACLLRDAHSDTNTCIDLGSEPHITLRAQILGYLIPTLHLACSQLSSL